MLKFYYSLAPNPMKVALFLEEAGLPYEALPVDTRKGEQHAPAFTALNPNAKVPVIVDGAVTVFDSNAILLYLAEKTGQFLPPAEERAVLLSWLMFIASGLGPYSGQSVHFKHYAPEPIPYAINRYDFEAWRHWKILDARLADQPWMMGLGRAAAGQARVRGDQPAACGEPRRRPEGAARLQDRDGRRSAARDVPAERAQEAVRR